MITNPIVDEVHRIREEMLASYGGDLHALIRDAQRRTEEAAKAGRVVVADRAIPAICETGRSRQGDRCAS